MHSPVITCGPQTPIKLVARTMADEYVHAVVVRGIECTAWSVVAALDLAAAAATDTIELVACDIAATAPVTATIDMPLPVATPRGGVVAPLRRVAGGPVPQKPLQRCRRVAVIQA